MLEKKLNRNENLNNYGRGRHLSLAARDCDSRLIALFESSVKNYSTLWL